MDIQCIEARVIGTDGAFSIIRASFILDGLVTLAGVTVALDESGGIADICPATKGAEAPSLAFETPLDRRVFAGLLAKALRAYVANIQAAARLQSLNRTIDTLTGTVEANTRELLRKVDPTGGVN